MPETVKILRPRLDAALAPETANADTRTVELQFYSGAEVSRYSWSKGEYMLRFSMDPAHVRLGQLNAGRAPLLESHSDWSTSDVLGVIEKGWLQNGKGMARARFAKDDPASDRVWNKVQQGILRNVSMGVMIHKLKETSGENDKIKSYLAVDWEPQEISVVPIGADPGAQMLAESRTESVDVEVLREQTSVVCGHPAKRSTKMEEAINNAGQETRMEETASPVPPAASEVQLNAARNIGVTVEQGRITGIIGVAKALKLGMAFAEQHIAANTPLEQFRIVAIDKAATEAKPEIPGPISGIRGELLRDEADKRRVNMTGALLERFLPSMWKFNSERQGFRYVPAGGQEMFEGSRLYSSCTLLDIAKECLAAQNIRWHTKSRTEIAQLAFQSTSDFGSILADVANKSLRAGYEMVPAQWRMIAARRSAADFKTVKEMTLDGSTRLTKVPESGEFKRGKLVEGKETWQLSTYGEIIAITRQAIINDDLGAFTRTPQLLGQEVAMLEADTVFSIVTTNGNMADGVALFHANHSNLIAAGGAAPSIDTLGATRNLMLLQKSTGGKVLGIQPKFLVAPAALSQVAEQYTSSAYQAVTAATVNPLAGKLTPIVEARLDAVDAKAWYLFADPNTPNGTVLIYAYLDGQDGPYTETRNGFDVDGVEIKIRHDFAAAAVDVRGAAKNPGQ